MGQEWRRRAAIAGCCLSVLIIGWGVVTGNSVAILAGVVLLAILLLTTNG